jgi:hypothetical protein
VAKLSEKVILEIAEKRRRASKPDLAAFWRSSILLQSFNNPAKHIDEILRYFPIAVVSVIEGYFRSRLAELISSGNPFLGNALKNYSEISLDMPLAGAIVKKEIGIAELVTHSTAMRLNSFGELVKVVSNVSGRQDFLGELAKVEPERLGSPDEGTRGEVIISDPEATWAHLGKVFGLRHILCHELAPDIALDKAETRLLLLASQEFIKASAIWFAKLQNPRPRPTFEEEFLRSKVRREEATENLASLLGDLKAISKAESTSERFREALDGTSRSVDSLLSSLTGLSSAGLDRSVMAMVEAPKLGGGITPEQFRAFQQARAESLERERMMEEYQHNDLLSGVVERLTTSLARIHHETRRRIELEAKYRDVGRKPVKKRRAKNGG